MRTREQTVDRVWVYPYESSAPDKTGYGLFWCAANILCWGPSKIDSYNCRAEQTTITSPVDAAHQNTWMCRAGLKYAHRSKVLI